MTTSPTPSPLATNHCTPLSWVSKQFCLFQPLHRTSSYFSFRQMRCWRHPSSIRRAKWMGERSSSLWLAKLLIRDCNQYSPGSVWPAFRTGTKVSMWLIMVDMQGLGVPLWRCRSARPPCMRWRSTGRQLTGRTRRTRHPCLGQRSQGSCGYNAPP